MAVSDPGGEAKEPIPGARPAVPDRYYTRRSLTARDQLPAIGVGILAGAAAFYLTYLFLQRTPLGTDEPRKPRPGRRSSK